MRIRDLPKTRTKNYFCFFHLAKTALRAISDRRSGESLAIRAGPPFRPPSLPNETAAGFFFLPIVLLERLGMGLSSYCNRKFASRKTVCLFTEHCDEVICENHRTIKWRINR